jgi:hypothetical protein
LASTLLAPPEPPLRANALSSSTWADVDRLAAAAAQLGSMSRRSSISSRSDSTPISGATV